MLNLVELARRLHEERLFIKHEQDTIWKLNEQVQVNAEQLSHTFWTTRQHYLNLNKLIVNSAQGTPTACSRRSYQLETVQFVDAYKELGHQESLYSQFLEAFINNPTIAAACLAYGDKLGLDATADVARIIVLGCYGNSIMTDDHKHLLELMETLMLLQLESEDQPRRLVQKGSCTFCVVFKLFTESLLAGKLFLTSALYQPVMEVLMDDDLFLETNAQKVLTRLSSYEIERKFGRQENPDFQKKINEHTKKAEDRLVQICSSFINSLLSAMCCFPQSLAWIIARSYHIVKDAGKVSETEARALCADFLLQQFVCPAIVTPELYGVTGDIPVSDLTRFNLMQIAQVLQVMAHGDEHTHQLSSFYSRLDKGPMQCLIDSVINSCNSDGVPNTSVGPHGYANSAVFFTPSQLSLLIQFLRDIQHSDVRGVDQSSLAAILSHLPSQPPPCMSRALNVNASTGSLATIEENGMQRGTVSGSLSPSGGSSGDLINGFQPSPNGGKKMFSKNGKAKTKPFKRDDASDSSYDDSATGDGSMQNVQDNGEVVLVISMTSLAGSSQELPGTMSETEVMEVQNAQNIANSAANMAAENASLDAGLLNESETLDKRSRFSLYSGGSDLSENGEEIPTEDGISSTSGSSSIDIDQAESVPADDTSSFHAVSFHDGNQDEDEEEGGDQESVTHANNDEALKALRRKLPTSRESIEDKMRKFEIRQELGVRFADPGVTGGPRRDEGGPPGASGAVDARSDTWSMDVYASDSEPPAEQDSQSERLHEIAEDPAEHIRSTSANLISFLTLTRDDDSRSDVWSVEVQPSDSEPPDVQSEDRLQELESESGNAATEDAMEDNRSRASTPGLSAASGFSGVSGLSLVSDNNHAKAGDEQWVSSERSYGKGPNSISPDAEDFLHLTRADSGSAGSSHGGGGSSNNSDMNDQPLPPSSSASPSPHMQQPSQSPLAMMTSKPRGDTIEAVRMSVSFDEATKKVDEDRRLQKAEGVEKTVAWNIPTPDTSPDDSKSPSGNSGLAIMDFNEHINTIKRSPYKRQTKDAVKLQDTDEQSATSSSHPERVIAWDEKIETNNTTVSITVNNDITSYNAGSSMVNHNPASMFVPVSPSKTPSHILKDFDPLEQSSGVEQTTKTKEKESVENDTPEVEPRPVSTGSDPFNLTGISTSLVDIHPPSDSSTVNEQNNTTKSSQAWNGLFQKEVAPLAHPKPTPPDYDSPGAHRKGIDRKKSWWKTNRLSTFAKKKVASKLNGPTNYDSGGSIGSDSPRHSGTFDPYTSGPDDTATINKTEIEVTPGDDIMQKYMKKVSSNQQMSASMNCDGEKVAQRGSADNSSGDTGDIHASFQSDSAEAQNMSGSSATDVQSPLSDDTVTTATRGASSTSSVPLVVDWPASSMSHPANEATAIPVSCPSKTYDSLNKSDSDLKEDAKRKLRIVLAMAEPLPEPPSSALLLLGVTSTRSNLGFSDDSNHDRAGGSERIKLRDQLLSFLRVQHAEALTLQDHSRIAQIHEVTRCVDALDDQGCRYVVKSLWREYKSRSAYIAYLVRSRQNLLAASSYLRHVTECTERDRSICRRYFTTQCVRSFLKRKESSINVFRNKFMKSVALDEKVTLVGNFLSWLYGQMVENQIWEAASQEQLIEGESCIERNIFTHVYKLAMFPNGDGDILRDELFHEHISRLSAIMTPAHPSLQVGRKYLLECPWPSAQREASALAAHRSPRGKLEAALRCCRAVMHLLKLADENKAPGADDFTPVLVFVLIKANPPHLLSTVQYVNSFVGEHLSGEDAYWWMQFTAATEFIKTIDERK